MKGPPPPYVADIVALTQHLDHLTNGLIERIHAGQGPSPEQERCVRAASRLGERIEQLEKTATTGRDPYALLESRALALFEVLGRFSPSDPRAARLLLDIRKRADDRLSQGP